MARHERIDWSDVEARLMSSALRNWYPLHRWKKPAASPT